MSPAFRLSAGSGGLEWPQVLALLAREARTPMGRELATATLSFERGASEGSAGASGMGGADLERLIALLQNAPPELRDDAVLRDRVAALAIEATRDALNALPADAQDRLVGLGLAGIEEYDAGKGWEKHLAPLWILSTAFYWQQGFPAGKTITVEHSYKPSVGSTAGLSFGSKEMRTGPYYEDYARKYCFDRTFLAAVDKRQKPDGNNTLMENRIEYILTTAANWAGNIRNFRLTIDKGSPDNLVSFCGEGVSKTGPTRFEMTKENFYPEEDLAIMILTPAPWAQ